MDATFNTLDNQRESLEYLIKEITKELADLDGLDYARMYQLRQAYQDELKDVQHQLSTLSKL